MFSLQPCELNYQLSKATCGPWAAGWTHQLKNILKVVLQVNLSILRISSLVNYQFFHCCSNFSLFTCLYISKVLHYIYIDRFIILLFIQEGKQASLAADFSITQFKHIGRLLMVHGRNSYKRSAALGQFVMHRGLIISTMQVPIFFVVVYVENNL